MAANEHENDQKRWRKESEIESADATRLLLLKLYCVRWMISLSFEHAIGLACDRVLENMNDLNCSRWLFFLLIRCTIQSLTQFLCFGITFSPDTIKQIILFVYDSRFNSTLFALKLHRTIDTTTRCITFLFIFFCRDSRKLGYQCRMSKTESARV